MYKLTKGLNTAQFEAKKAFTLIELLIVIALIAIIAAVAFTALDPLTRFRDARDSARWSDVAAILSAIKIDQVDNGGTYLGTIATTTAGQVYMISTLNAGCDDNNGGAAPAVSSWGCDNQVNSDTNCVDLSPLVTEGYLGSVPISPTGSTTWSTALSGYTLIRSSTGILGIQACESENTTDIRIER
jgi:prepilin-type N-terminal cleavage/methylation domain-containing protein